MLRLVNTLWLLLLVSLILIAAYVSLGRYCLSLATESPQKVQQILEKVLEQPVHIRAVQGHWHFLSPSIALHDVRLGAHGDEPAADDSAGASHVQAVVSESSSLDVGFLHVGVDVFRTLFAREVRLSFLHISGLKVGIYAANGRIERIEGLNLFKPHPVDGSPRADQEKHADSGGDSGALMARVPRLLQNLLAYKGLIFKEIQVTLHTPKHSQKFLAKQLSLVEVGGQYHIQAQLELLEGRPVVMSLRSVMQGQLMVPDTWSGRFYVDIDRTPAAVWLKQLPMLKGRLESLDVGGALWGEFDGARLGELTGRAAVYALEYWFPSQLQSDQTLPSTASSEPRSVKLPYAAAQFNWLGEIGGVWEMRLQEIQIQSGNEMFKPGTVYVARAPKHDEPTQPQISMHTEQAQQSVDQAALQSTRFVQGTPAFRVQGQAFAVAPIARLIQQLGILPKASIEQLKTASPQGDIKQFEVTLHKQDDAWRWAASANLVDLQWTAVTPVPGVSGLNIRVAANDAGGAMQIDAQAGELDMRPNFREIIPLDRFSVPILWSRDPDDGLQVRSGLAVANNEDATATAMLALTVPPPKSPASLNPPAMSQATLPNKIQNKPRLSLIAGLTKGTAQAKVSRYLPTKNMAPSLVRWLDKSLVTGDLESGHFVYEGSFDKIPYAAKTFQMRFVVNDATIDYLAPWPQLTQARVDAFINRREGQFLVPHAKVYEAEITNGNVELPYFDRGEAPHLKIDLQAKGDIQQGLRVLRESPLRNEVGDIIDDVQATAGEMLVKLALDVPLGGPSEAEKADQHEDEVVQNGADAQEITPAGVLLENGEVAQKDAALRKNPKPEPVLADVAVHLKAVDAQVPPWQLTVNDINGPFRFKSGKGIYSEGLKGLFLGRSVEAEIHNKLLKVQSEDVKRETAMEGPQRATEISLAGSVDAKALVDWQGLPILSFLEGQAGYRADVTLYPKAWEKAPNLTVQTDLRGMAVKLPSPVGKVSDETKDLTLSFDFGEPRHVTLLSRGIAGMGLRFDSGELDAVRIHLGADKLVRAQTPGVVITGDTPALFLQPWIDFIEAYQNRSAEFTKVAAQSAPKEQSANLQADEEGFDWLSQLKWVDISANALGYSEKLINQATVQVARIADVWQVTLQGAEISGIVSLPMLYFEGEFLDRIRTGRTSAKVRERMNARPIMLDIGFLALPAEDAETNDALPDFITGPSLTRIDALAAEADEEGSENVALNVPEPPVLHDGYRLLPPFNLRLRRLFLGGTAYGAWSGEARVTPLGLSFNNIKGSLHNINFDGQGAWTASLGGPATSIVGRAFSQDLASTLSGLGFAPSIESQNALLDVDLKWQGRPWDFDLLTAEGELDMAVTDGTLLNINTTASTVRVIGLLNIEMLTRRMQLDFSDVLNKGMQFQLLGGKFDLREGVLFTDHTKLRGASAQFDISGQVSLRAKAIDTEMSVTLPVTRNLVLPAAATGGLPAAATAFVIEKALGDKLDKLTTMRFTVAGDWNDPQIIRRKRQVNPRENRPGR